MFEYRVGSTRELKNLVDQGRVAEAIELLKKELNK